ncbi:MAG: hypothetical protein QXK06_02045, partial [Candidatus Diapherotrites archaeon]
MKKTLLVLAALLFFPCCFAIVLPSQPFEGISINRIAPEQAIVGQKAWIGFSIENLSSQEKTIELTEKLGNANFDESQAKFIETEYGEKFWHYYWKIRLSPKETTSVFYWIEPKNPGTYVLTPAEVKVGGELFFLKSHSIAVKCLSDGKCSPEQGENQFNCFEDCNSGIQNQYCDFETDGICDPDCIEGADPDCMQTETKTVKTSEQQTQSPVPSPMQSQQENSLVYWISLIALLALAGII